MFGFWPFLVLILSAFIYEVWGVPLVWLVMLFAAWKYKMKTAFLWGFIVGMIMAAAGGRGWGVYSLILVGEVMIVWTVKRFVRNPIIN